MSNSPIKKISVISEDLQTRYDNLKAEFEQYKKESIK